MTFADIRRRIERDRYCAQVRCCPPTQPLATIYHALEIAVDTIIYNHLNRPYELVKAEVASKLLAS